MNEGRDDATSQRFKKSGDQKYLFSVVEAPFTLYILQ